jgi:hypothetical protein
MAQIAIPPLSPTLVEALDKRFPERCPDPAWSDREIWRRVGQREVVRLLRQELEKQQHNILRDTVFVQS